MPPSSISSPDHGGDHLPADEPELPPARSRPRDLKRALGLTALSALLPGLGLTRTRAKRAGVVLVALAVALGVALVAYVLVNGVTGTALGTAASTTRLKVLTTLLVLGALLWIAAIALTAVLTRPEPTTRSQRIALTLFAGLLSLVVATPAAVGVRYVAAHLSAVDKIFRDTPVAGQEEFPRDRSSDDPWAGVDRVNVLLLGSDAGDNRTGVRTDSMMVASVHPATGDTVLLSVPRNLQNVPVPASLPLSDTYPDGFDCGPECLMNAIWSAAEADAQERPGRYAGDPAPGETATREVLSAVLGEPIHRTVIVNLEGFTDLIDAMGGVRINVKERIPLGGQTWKDAEGRSHLIPGTEHGWLEPGVRNLNGYQALSYSRSRVTSDDFSRMRRQRCMVAAVVDQADPVRLLQRYPQIVGAVGDNVTTDISRGELPDWATLLRRMQDGTIRSLPFTATNTDVADPDFEEIRAKVDEALHAPPPSTDDATTTTGRQDAAATSSDETGATTDAPGSDDATVTTSDAPPTDKLEEIGAVCD